MRSPQASPGGTPANDALLIQLVRGALGEDGRSRGTPRINVSSCKFVVTLHGTVRDEEERDRIGGMVRTVPGVRGVENRLGVT
jgi:osmotically-inducible protein OsmY